VANAKRVVVVLALILATLATLGIAGVFMYADGVTLPGRAGGPMVSVVVSEVDIPAGTDLDRLIEDDQFKIIQIPKYAVIDGAIASIDSLRGKKNEVRIRAGKQIPFARINGA
jgi:Flp pilus assembly protein CpaB